MKGKEDVSWHPLLEALLRAARVSQLEGPLQ